MQCNAYIPKIDFFQMHLVLIINPKEVHLSIQQVLRLFLLWLPLIILPIVVITPLETFTSAQTYQANMPQHCSKVTKATQQPKTCEKEFISITASFPT